jgi:hypothetical protein
LDQNHQFPVGHSDIIRQSKIKIKKKQTQDAEQPIGMTYLSKEVKTQQSNKDLIEVIEQ